MLGRQEDEKVYRECKALGELEGFPIEVPPFRTLGDRQPRIPNLLKQRLS